MGQTLTNGIYLPDEGEVRCYDGLASNWTTLDAVVGGYRAHVANENIHITSAERNKWDNGVSQAYVLRYANTSLTALGTVAFSALDNTDNIKIGDKVLDSEGKLFALTAVDTANTSATLSALLIDLSKDSDLSNYYTKGETDNLLSDKANDADAVHKSEAETIEGQKTFVDYSFTSSGYGFIGQGNRTSYILPEFTGGYSGLSIVTPDFNKSVKIGSWTTDENTGKKILNTATGYLQISTGSLNGINTVGVTPVGAVNSNLGTVSNKWKTFNGSTPSSLGMPDLNNAVDISGYITDLAGSPNIYSPPANGYIVLRSATANVLGVVENTTGMGSYSRGTNQTLAVNLPVVKGSSIAIYVVCSSLTHAKFIPCLGNV